MISYQEDQLICLAMHAYNQLYYPETGQSRLGRSLQPAAYGTYVIKLDVWQGIMCTLCQKKSHIERKFNQMMSELTQEVCNRTKERISIS